MAACESPLPPATLQAISNISDDLAQYQAYREMPDDQQFELVQYLYLKWKTPEHFDPAHEVQLRVLKTPQDGRGYLLRRSEIPNVTPGLLQAIDSSCKGMISIYDSMTAKVQQAPGGPIENMSISFAVQPASSNVVQPASSKKRSIYYDVYGV